MFKNSQDSHSQPQARNPLIRQDYARCASHYQSACRGDSLNRSRQGVRGPDRAPASGPALSRLNWTGKGVEISRHLELAFYKNSAHISR